MAVRVQLVMMQRKDTPERKVPETSVVKIRGLSVSENTGDERAARPPAKPKNAFMCDQKAPGQ